MQANWYYHDGQKQVGPFNLDVLKAMCAQGVVGANQLAWCQGMRDWQPVAAIPELGVIAAAPPPMQPQLEAVGATNRQWLKNFGYYTTWFVVWGVIFSFLQPVTSEQMAGTTFAALKLLGAVLGAGFGMICAIVFCLLQNGVNGRRRKWLSWMLAISTWVSINLVVAVAMGRFQ